MKKVILLSLIILFLSKTQNIFAKTDTFIVDNIEVTGKINDINYRETYLTISFRKGFQSLIENILKKEDQNKLSGVSLETIKSLVESYRILEENDVSGKYKLKTQVTFSRSLINDFFYKKNISYSEVTRLNIVVYPILILNSELQLFEKNQFLIEWNDNKELKNIDFILPVENVDDINFIKDNLTSLEERNIDRLVDNYEIKNSSILIFRKNDKDLNVFLKTNFQGTRKVKKFEFGNRDIEKKEVRAQIIKNLKSRINDFWKEQNLIDISTPSFLTVSTKIKSADTLSQIIKKFDSMNLIDQYRVETMDKNNLKIKIKYFGKIKNLQDSFIENGFKFKILHNEWNLILES